MWQKWACRLSIIVLFIVSAVALIVGRVTTDRVDKYLELSKDAGTPQQVAEFLTSYKEELYAGGYVTDKNRSVFRYPAMSMDRYIRTVDGLIGRANALATQAATDTSYQMGLLNLEKDLGDMHVAAWYVWLADGAWIWWVTLVFGVIVGCYLLLNGIIEG